VFLFNLSSSSPTRLLLRLRRRLRAVTWLPDKTKLIVGLSERPSDIVLFDQGS
jgi:hypothetical protein